jgi:hypothetical protein
MTEFLSMLALQAINAAYQVTKLGVVLVYWALDR